MDDCETELSRFRQRWKEEVTARHNVPQPESSSSSETRPPVPAFSARKLSHSSTIDVSEGQEAILPLSELNVRERSVSPAVVRRTPVSVPTVPGVPESALEHYEGTVGKGTQGGESLNLYTVDATVDTCYRENYLSRPLNSSPSTSKDKPVNPPTLNTAHHSPAPPPASLTSNSKNVSDLVASFAHHHIEAALLPCPDGAEALSETEPLFSLLSTLPSELLLHILHSLAVTDVASFVRCAQVCKALAFLVITEQSIWRDVCITTYKRMLWDWSCQVTGEELINRPLLDPSDLPEEDIEEPEEEIGEPEDRTIPVDDVLLAGYGGNWRKMFISRPRVRFNGIYISTCSYVRSGVSQKGWNTPVHIIMYYRYLRFYPDGTVLSLLTTTEPVDVVYAFNRPALTPAHLSDAPAPAVAAGAWAKYVSRGRWRLDPEGRVDVETESPRGGSMERYLFRMQMRIRNVKAAGRMGVSNKLAWEGFWSWNRLTDDLAEFSLRNDKAFVFSRVGSIEREIGVL